MVARTMSTIAWLVVVALVIIMVVSASLALDDAYEGAEPEYWEDVDFEDE